MSTHHGLSEIRPAGPMRPGLDEAPPPPTSAGGTPLAACIRGAHVAKAAAGRADLITVEHLAPGSHGWPAGADRGEVYR